MKIVSLFICILFCSVQLPAKSPSIVIIGGGPAGLATAIEAHEAGAQVTVVEKRRAYTRLQWVILFDSSLRLLDKWKVTAPQMNVAEIGNGQRIGFVQLKYLEERLEARIQELGITKLVGECTGITINERNAHVFTEGNQVPLHYDIIVGADGCHSRIREVLGIAINNLGTASAASALIPIHSPIEEIDVTPAVRKGEYFIKKILTPGASIIFVQSTTETKFPLDTLAEECGWEREAALIAADKAFVLTDIEVLLQQAQTFSDAQKSAILVGDAAACASFFEGRGANTAFLTAAHAGDFFKKIESQEMLAEALAYETFNKEMKKTTDELLDDSRYLFPTVNASCL